MNNGDLFELHYQDMAIATTSLLVLSTEGWVNRPETERRMSSKHYSLDAVLRIEVIEDTPRPTIVTNL
jgi:hypothetical protein